MATKGERRLWLAEHRAARGIKVPVIAAALGMQRESVYKLERHWERATAQQQLIYAQALGIEPAALWERPVGILKAARLSEGHLINLSDNDIDRIATRLYERTRKKRP